MKRRLSLRLTRVIAMLFVFWVVLYDVETAPAGPSARVTPPMYLVSVSGDKLAHACRTETEGSFEDGVCLGYVLGISDAVNNFAVAGREACIPRNVLNAQVQYIVRRYLADHPELLDRTALELVAAALSDAFPCSAG